MAALAFLAALTGCTSWVTPSPEAQRAVIAVVTPEAAARCQLLTRNELTVTSKIGSFERMPGDVENDLRTLAINQAASAGGDAVAPLSPVTEGKQIYGIYKCGAAAGAPATAAPSTSTAVTTLPYTPPR